MAMTSVAASHVAPARLASSRIRDPSTEPDRAVRWRHPRRSGVPNGSQQGSPSRGALDSGSCPSTCDAGSPRSTRCSAPNPGRRAVAHFGRAIVKRTLVQTIEETRAAAERGIDPPTDDELLAHAVGLASKIATGLTPVINATGVVLHTNLGSAPLPEAAALAAARAARTLLATSRSTAIPAAGQALDAGRATADRPHGRRGRARGQQLRRRAPAQPLRRWRAASRCWSPAES